MGCAVLTPEAKRETLKAVQGRKGSWRRRKGLRRLVFAYSAGFGFDGFALRFRGSAGCWLFGLSWVHADRFAVSCAFGRCFGVGCGWVDWSFGLVGLSDAGLDVGGRSCRALIMRSLEIAGTIRTYGAWSAGGGSPAIRSS